MAYNGSGTFVRLYNWVTDKTNLVPVTASRMDAEMDGMATGLSTVITKDGQTATSARIPFAAGMSAFAGAVGGVAYAQTSDPNTGMYFPATDEVALAAGGVQAISATATGITIPGTLTVTGAITGVFPSGTAIILAQTAAPTGWTKSVAHNDKALRVVSGTASSGGSSAFSTVFSKTATDAFTLATANLPAYTPTGSTTYPGEAVALSSGVTAQFATTTGSLNAGATTFLIAGSGTTLGVTGTTNVSAIGMSFTGDAQGGTATGKTAPIDLRVHYVDVCIFTKD